ncbi:MAG: hypothetical protein KJ645_00610, partial [Planctomycetes bacterium]|nr:hypothetical protein [Planctomycetota bacterium]
MGNHILYAQTIIDKDDLLKFTVYNVANTNTITINGLTFLEVSEFPSSCPSKTNQAIAGDILKKGTNYIGFEARNTADTWMYGFEIEKNGITTVYAAECGDCPTVGCTPLYC